MLEKQETIEQCAGCGLAVQGGTAGCQEIFEELLARDFSDAAYFRCHRMMVDTYCLQHPDRYCVSGKSLAAHLTSLCWLVEHGGSQAVGSEALRHWLDGPRRIEKPPIPSFRGALTIADVRRETEPSAYAAAMERWALSTWGAYASLHALARQWIRQALDGEGPRRG